MDSLFTRENCQGADRATRAAVLVDADAYYRALYSTLSQAKREVLLLGWDIDSRLCLRRDLDDAGRREATLGVLFDSLARRGVECHLLTWDFVPIYAFEREPLTAAALDWTTHRRLRFELDGVHPHGASHHQKIVVVDDSVAFCGGIDLCGARWDTPAHKLDDPLRIDPPHAAHKPFHDVQMVVEGPIATRLGALCRERWRRATGERLAARAPHKLLRREVTKTTAPWPEGVAAEFVDVDVALARTEPPLEGRPAVREVEQMYVDLIAAAQDTIYFENQYLTSRVVSEALQQRLSEANGPEVGILVPSVCSGWMEENTMGARRSAFLRALTEADKFNRCIVVAPRISAAPGTPRLNVHGKVAIIDERFLRVGSANLSNRSMGLDTECDLVIDARGDAVVAAGVSGVRARLLSEHLDESVDVIKASLAARGLKGTIEHLSRPDQKERTVTVVEPTDPAIPAALIPLTVLADPEAPAAMDPLMGRGPAGVGPPRQRLRAAVAVAFAVVLCFGLAALWRFSPLAELVAPDRLRETLQPIVQGPKGPFVGIAVFVIGGIFFFPLTLLVLQSGLLFSPVVAVGVSIVGSLSSASLSFFVGRAVGGKVVARLIGREQLRAVAALEARGIWAIAALRLAPVAPFTLVNLAAGAARVRFSTFILGTMMGMLPGILALTLIGQGLLSLLQKSSIEFVVVFAVAGVVATVLARLLVRRHKRKKKTAPSTATAAPSFAVTG